MAEWAKQRGDIAAAPQLSVMNSLIKHGMNTPKDGEKSFFADWDKATEILAKFDGDKEKAKAWIEQQAKV